MSELSRYLEPVKVGVMTGENKNEYEVSLVFPEAGKEFVDHKQASRINFAVYIRKDSLSSGYFLGRENNQVTAVKIGHSGLWNYGLKSNRENALISSILKLARDKFSPPCALSSITGNFDTDRVVMSFVGDLQGLCLCCKYLYKLGAPLVKERVKERRLAILSSLQIKKYEIPGVGYELQRLVHHTEEQLKEEYKRIIGGKTYYPKFFPYEPRYPFREFRGVTLVPLENTSGGVEYLLVLCPCGGYDRFFKEEMSEIMSPVLSWVEANSLALAGSYQWIGRDPGDTLKFYHEYLKEQTSRVCDS